MKCTASITNSKLLCLLLVLLHHSWSNPSPFSSLWDDSVSENFIFMTMLGAKENFHHFLSTYQEYPHSNIHNKEYLQIIYRTIQNTTHPLLLTQILMKKGANCVKTHERIWETFIVKIRFLFVVYSMVPVRQSSSSLSWQSSTSSWIYWPSWISEHKKVTLNINIYYVA